MSLIFLLVVIGAIIAVARLGRRRRHTEIERPTERELLDAIDHWEDLE